MDDFRDTQKRLIEVAIDLFASRGFRGTSIRDIACAMGMSISNIYHYFGSKEGLLLSILQNSAKQVVDQLDLVNDQESDPVERFKSLIKTHILMSKDHKKEVKIFFLDEEHLSQEGIEINKQFQRDVLNIYKRELETLKTRGYIRYENLTALALNILGVINWQLRWYRPDGSIPLEKIAEEILTFIMYGVIGQSDFDKAPATKK